MKKIILLSSLVIAFQFSFAQSRVPIRGDTIEMLKVNGNAEFILKNATRNKTGAFLQNGYDGRTKFAYAVDSAWLNDAGDSIIFRRGSTTFKIPGGSGGGGGPFTTEEWVIDYIDFLETIKFNYWDNLGTLDTLFRQINDSTWGIKSIGVQGINGITVDSVITADQIQYIIDGSGVGGLSGMTADRIQVADNATTLIDYSTLRYDGTRFYVGTPGQAGILDVRGFSDDIYLNNPTGAGSFLFQTLDATKITFGPTGVITSIAYDTDGAAPSTTGTTKMLITDATGKFSFKDEPTGSGESLAAIKTGSWSNLSDSVSISDRDGAELWYIPEQDSLIMVGGWHTDHVPKSNKEVYKYNRDFSFWRRLPDAPWTVGLHCFGSHYQNDSLFVWGADAESPAVQEYWVFKVSTSTWSLLNAAIVADSRWNYASPWHGNRPYMIGGMNPTATDSTNATRVVTRGDFTRASAWTEIATGLTQFGGIYSGSAASFNGYIYLIAGVGWASDEEDRDYKHSVWRSLDGITWERRGDVPFNETTAKYFGTGRGFVKVVPSYDGRLLGLFFGYQRVPASGIEDFRDCYVMDEDENWSQLPSIPENMDGRHAAAVAAVPDGWIISTGFLDNDAWKYEIYDATIVNGGNFFGYPIKIGSRDAEPLSFITHDTARLSIYRDSIVGRTFLRLYDNREPNFAPTSDYTMLGLLSNGSGSRIRFGTLVDTTGLINYDDEGMKLSVHPHDAVDRYGWEFKKTNAAVFGYNPVGYTNFATDGGFLQINTAGTGQIGLSIHPVGSAAPIKLYSDGVIEGALLKLTGVPTHDDTSVIRPWGIHSINGFTYKFPSWKWLVDNTVGGYYASLTGNNTLSGQNTFSGPTIFTNNVFLSVDAATDADKTVLYYFTTLPTITANRTVTLPSGAGNNGRVFVLQNTNTSGTFSWSVNTALTLPSGSTVTTLANGTSYKIIYDHATTTFHIMN